jgi:ankyrin repeat protein
VTNLNHGAADIMRRLIHHGADVAAQDENNVTPLHLAALSGVAQTFQLLVEHGADATARDKSNKTTLHFATSWVSFPAAILFIQQRADLTLQEDRQNYGLRSQERANIVQLLIEQRVEVTAEDEMDSTPLHMASSSGFLEIAHLLIQHGADVTARDLRYRTPLHLASSWVSSETALFKTQPRDDING